MNLTTNKEDARLIAKLQKRLSATLGAQTAISVVRIALKTLEAKDQPKKRGVHESN